MFNRSCLNFEHFSFKTSNIFLTSVKTVSSKLKISSIYPLLKIVGPDKHGKQREKTQISYDG